MKLRDDWILRVADNRCGMVGCDDDLDTGWECHTCGADFYLGLDAMKAIKRIAKKQGMYWLNE